MAYLLIKTAIAIFFKFFCNFNNNLLNPMKKVSNKVGRFYSNSSILLYLLLRPCKKNMRFAKIEQNKTITYML